MSYTVHATILVLMIPGVCFPGTVVPSADQSVEAAGNNCYPFSPCIGTGTMRYQQVYAASEFAAPTSINQISFRPDGVSGLAGTLVIPDLLVRLSTTAAPVDFLSNTFDSNLGADAIIVFNGPLTIETAAAGPVGGPKAFDVIIPLATTFLFNPSAGNLLLDIQNFGNTTFSGAGPNLFLDATTPTSVDSVSRMWNFDVTSPTGFQDSTGLVTQFGTVPEPGYAWIGLSFLAFCAVRGISRK